MIKIKGVIDPGHGGNERYNIGQIGYNEADAMLPLSRYLKAELESTGAFDIKLTRESLTTTLSLSQRCQIAKDFGADFLISEHTNAEPKKTARGTVVFYSIKRPVDKVIASNISRSISSLYDVKDFGARIRESEKYPGNDYYTIINGAVARGIKHVFIVESLFHSNLEDERILLEDANIRLIAKTQAKCICDFYKITYGEGVTNMYEGQGVIKATVLNIRSGAGTTFAIKSSVVQGSVVQVLGKVGNWYLIKYNNLQGYVSAEFVTYTPKAPTPTVPVIESITKLYREILHREPDVEGLANWIRQAQKGMTLDRMRVILSESEEAKKIVTPPPVAPTPVVTPPPVDPIPLDRFEGFTDFQKEVILLLEKIADK